MGLLPQPPARIAAGSVKFAGEELTTASPARMEKIRGAGISMGAGLSSYIGLGSHCYQELTRTTRGWILE